MIKTVGERDLYTASITHKMAEHLMRMGQHEGQCKCHRPHGYLTIF